MNIYVPTIHELNRLPESALRAMFRHAASVAASDQHPTHERTSARRTQQNIKHSLSLRALRL